MRAGIAVETWDRSAWKNLQVKGILPWITLSQKGHSIGLSLLLSFLDPLVSFPYPSSWKTPIYP